MNTSDPENISRNALKFFLLMAILCSACNLSDRSGQTNSNPAANENAFEIPKPDIALENPLEISAQPKDLELCKHIVEIIKDSKFSKARWGMIAISLNDGRVVCGQDGRTLFNPASVQKILTSIVALDKLGVDFRWKTSIYSGGKITDGTISGDLFLYGQGSPDLDDAGLNDLVRQLKQKGVKEVKGDIVGDESYFKGDNFGDGWTWSDLQWYYGAASSALSINRNQMNVTLQNGKPRSDSEFVELSGEVRPVEDIEAIGLQREIGTNQVYVWGNGKNLDVRLAINKPALFSARILKEQLEKNGIKVGGKAISRDWKNVDKLDTENATELGFIESQTLAAIVQKMNKDSVNLYAELMLRTIGKKFGDEAPDENPKMQKLRGDDSAGASVIKKWLAEHDIATDEIAIHDGSGLSRLDFVTPEAVVRALVFASQSKFADIFKNSLPVAGQSGTLKGRLGRVSGKILGKTGSITYVNSLAGFAKAKTETYAFVIIGNNLTDKSNSNEVIDNIALSLVDN